MSAMASAFARPGATTPRAIATIPSIDRMRIAVSSGCHLGRGPYSARYLVLHFPQGLVEDGHRQVDLFLAHGEGWGDAPDAAALRAAADVHAQAELEAALGRERAQLMIRLARFAVLHELHAPQQAHAADVADLLMARLKLSQGFVQVVAH